MKTLCRRAGLLIAFAIYFAHFFIQEYLFDFTKKNSDHSINSQHVKVILSFCLHFLHNFAEGPKTQGGHWKCWMEGHKRTGFCVQSFINSLDWRYSYSEERGNLPCRYSFTRYWFGSGDRSWGFLQFRSEGRCLLYRHEEPWRENRPYD